MASAESHAVRNGIVATVLGGLILAALGEVWPPIKQTFGWLWKQVVVFTNLLVDMYTIPGWALTIMGGLASVTVMRAVIAWRSASVTPTFDAPYLKYMEQILFGAKWRWSWSAGQIANLWCYCPVCDGELVYDDSMARRASTWRQPQTLFICEHCDNSVIGTVDGGGKHYALSVVKRDIDRRIRTGQYPGA